MLCPFADEGSGGVLPEGGEVNTLLKRRASKALCAPASPVGLCGRVQAHGASCVLSAAHSGPCFVVPVEEFSLYGDGEAAPPEMADGARKARRERG